MYAHGPQFDSKKLPYFCQGTAKVPWPLSPAAGIKRFEKLGLEKWRLKSLLLLDPGYNWMEPVISTLDLQVAIRKAYTGGMKPKTIAL